MLMRPRAATGPRRSHVASAARVALVACLLVACNARARATNSLTRVVHTRYGKMRGIVETSGDGSGGGARVAVEMFLGVPYATPPTGPNRFSPTRASTPWDGVKLLDQLGPVCPQWLPDVANETEALRRMPKARLRHLERLLPYLRNQSEDCLYLNIYAPASDGNGVSARRYPVLVYFHGESYSWNSGNPYDGRVLAGYADLVVVTFNYRLGVLGFLNVNSEPHQKARVANYGLMDQIAALHWIQQNIDNFNGDASNVTLVGHGTGAACVNFLMISPAVMPGLFQRTILLSGSALSSWALVQEPLLYSLEIARQMNCSGGGGGGGDAGEETAENHDRIVDCLRRVPLARLAEARVAAPTFLNAFGPSVDGVVIRADFQRDLLADAPPPDSQPHAKAAPPLLHRQPKPRDATKTTAAALGKYDLLLGCVTGEALSGFSDEDIRSGFEGERRDRILRTYIRNTYDYHLSEIFYTVVNEYTDWERTVLHPINTRDSTVAALSDAQFVAPLVRTGDQLGRSAATATPASGKGGNSVAARPVKAFFYVFDYQTRDADYPQRAGTVHGEDLPYIFGAPLAHYSSHFSRNFTKQEVALSEALMTYVANFARVGNPNTYEKQEATLPVSRERNRFKGMIWEEYDPVHQKYLEISTKPKVKNHFRAHQLSVWLRLIPELHRAGMEDVTLRHNMFHSHESALYEGVVRADRHSTGVNVGVGVNVAVHSQTSRRSYSTASRDQATAAAAAAAAAAQVVGSPTTFEPSLTTCVNPPNTTTTTNAGPAAAGSIAAVVVVRPNDSQTAEAAVAAVADAEVGAAPSGDHLPTSRVSYSASLALTIAIGGTLLVLNGLIYAFVYYQRDKTRTEIKSLREQQMQRQQPQPQPQQQQQPSHQHALLQPAPPTDGQQPRYVRSVESPPASPFPLGTRDAAAFTPHWGGATAHSLPDGAYAVAIRDTASSQLPAADDGSAAAAASTAMAMADARNTTGHQRRRLHQPQSHCPPRAHHPPHLRHQQPPSQHRYSPAAPTGGHDEAAAASDSLESSMTAGGERSNRTRCTPSSTTVAPNANSNGYGRGYASEHSSLVVAAAAAAAAAATRSPHQRRSTAEAPSPQLHTVGGHLSSSTQSLHKCPVLKVPAAAISEMRV